MVCHKVGECSGGSSTRHILAQRKSEAAKATTSARPACRERIELMKKLDPLIVPTAREITEKKMQKREAARVAAPAESPVELRQFCEKMGQVQDDDAKPFTKMDRVTTDGRTCVPITCKHLVKALKDFIHRAQQQTGRLKCFKLLGDATHDQSKQGLNKI